MANALTDFTKKREFLICMDSDGCVMDTVRIKHSTVMCPELIRVFALDDHADFITAAWDEINLHTITRGISRFESVRLVFDRLKNRGIEIPGSEDIAAWVDTATELSTASLQRELQKTGSLALRKLQEWNNACNRRIQALEPTFEPFPGVEESLRQLHAVADVAVVSAANESAIASEWKRYGLARHADVIFGQEVGSKANSIATMLACGYESRKVMMVGDAMGDAQAAVEDMRMAYEAAREGWLDQLPQTGLENSWRYQNGRRVDADENGVATLSLPDGVSTFSANGHWGIDVSRHQGTIDWKAVKNAGVEFAVIRCGYGDDETDQDDSQWERNVSQCEKLGIPYGVYLYSYATSTSQAASSPRGEPMKAMIRSLCSVGR